MTSTDPAANAVRFRHPLSRTQEAWCEAFGDAAYDNPDFAISDTLHVHGPLDLGALQGALDDVVARHEILRTEMVRHADPRYQVVHPPGPAALRVWPVPVTSEAGRPALIQALADEFDQFPLPPGELPVLRAAVAEVGPEEWLLHVASHHTVADAWSIQLIQRDLAMFYRSRMDGTDPGLPPAEPFGAFVEWEHNRERDPVARAARAWWRSALDGAEIFTLPSDRPVGLNNGTRYVAEPFQLSTDVTLALDEAARSSRCTRFMALLTAFGVLAHELRGTGEPVVNCLSSGRYGRQFRDTVGLFINFAPLRVALPPGGSFADALLATRAVCLDAFAHAAPIEDIEEDNPTLMAPLGGSHNADTIFNYFSYPFAHSDMPFGRSTEAVRAGADEATDMPVGLSWSLGATQARSLNGKVQYNPAEFDQTTIRRWCDRYCAILTAAAADPTRPWAGI